MNPTFHPCVVVPYYNHPATIETVVQKVVAAGLPCLVVDDGSEAQARQAVESLVEAPQVFATRHDLNRGKGAAVKTGLRWAHDHGFTHVVQLDADAQHNLDDVPRFVKAARTNPKALVLGRPLYDQSIPARRHIGRYITNVWVWIETLSLAIKDTQCGFRVYPLSAVIPLLEQTPIGDRMQFDIDIVVRLYWQGTPLVNIETPVTYPPSGVSHFRLWDDNVAISRLHTKLFLGMLPRAPKLLLRKVRKSRHTPTDWLAFKERGAMWGLRFTLWAYQTFGQRISTAVVSTTVGYFFLTAPAARRASLDYLRKVYATASGRRALPAKPGPLVSYCHFLEFGLAVLDKFAVWLGQIEPEHIEWPNRDVLLELLEKGQGAVLLGSHLGNIEVLRGAYKEPGLKINAFIMVSNAERFNRVLKEINPEVELGVISAGSIGADTAIMLKEKIDRGEFVSLLGDRATADGRHRVSRVPFFGYQAAFPHGPMILASLLECPVYLLFALRVGPGKYRVHFELFADKITLPRKNRTKHLSGYLEKYAQRLEHHAKLAPLQWFNFYDFWA